MFFFHLKLELYSSLVGHSQTSSSPTIFVPSEGSDIFHHTAFPAHRTTNWKHNAAWQSATSPPDVSSHQRSSIDDRGTLQGKALLLPEKSNNLKEPAPHSPARRSLIKPTNETTSRDWRYGMVSIESIDMESTPGNNPSDKNDDKNTYGGLHTKASYIPSDVKATDVGWGVVHLYRDSTESKLRQGAKHSKPNLTQSEEEQDHFRLEDCTTLCILAVPSWMMPSDLLGFVGDQARAEVSHFRLIRTERANKYMVLMKFRSAKRAREWQKTYNGRLFSAAEPENCHVVFIKSVEFLTSETDAKDALSFPRNTNDPFTGTTSSNNLSSRPFAPPPPNLLELPTCPVCLERMDETTGLLTILCQHVFHCACLEKWRGSGCPVCRYTHSPSFTFPYPRPSTTEIESEPVCSVCASSANLWICLICGSIGCGRYDSAHAYAHYEDTSHCYAMDIETQHVWDYAGDGYVHRLIQSKPEMKSSDSHSIPPIRHENEAFRSEGSDNVPREKMESMATEYTYLLSSQLEGQRRYFEEQVERAVDKASSALAKADDAAAQVLVSRESLQRSTEDNKKLIEALNTIEKTLDKSEKARKKFEQMARDISTQLREERVMNEGLSKRITAAEDMASEAMKEKSQLVIQVAELEEMNRDLTMFISGQEKIKELQARGEDVVDGDVSLPPGQSKKKGKGRKR